MDPLTLFALANGAVAAVKQGCKLYNDIKAATGDVKGILKDLEDQFHTKHKDSPPTVAEKNQYIQEKNRVLELSKQETGDIYAQIGEQLGAFFENMATCQAIFEEEERHAKEVYTGSVSLGKRALQRVLMESKLVAMQAELREIMVYQSPKELGDLYTRVEKMMKKIKEEQSIAVSKKMREDRERSTKRRIRIEHLKHEIAVYGGIFACILIFVLGMNIAVELRKDYYPELGKCFLPKGTFLYRAYNNLRWVDCNIEYTDQTKQ